MWATKGFNESNQCKEILPNLIFSFHSNTYLIYFIRIGRASDSPSSSPPNTCHFHHARNLPGCHFPSDYYFPVLSFSEFGSFSLVIFSLYLNARPFQLRQCQDVAKGKCFHNTFPGLVKRNETRSCCRGS